MKNKILFFGLFGLFVGLTAWMATMPIEGLFEEIIIRYGYIGFLFTSFLGGLNLALPPLHLALIIPFLNAGLGLWILVILGTIGTTLADSVGYALGSTGEKSFKEFSRFRKWGDKFISKHPTLAPILIIIWAAFVPIPNEAFVIPAGIIRYGFWRTISLTFTGNIIFNLITIGLGNLLI